MMFTGLVETTATITQVTELNEGRRLHVSVPFAAQLVDGESIAVNGVCLTVADRDAAGFVADIMPGTIRVTTLGELQPGSRVNVERALLATSRLGGHIVQGHVDAVGVVIDYVKRDQWNDLTIEVPNELTKYIVSKGSIAVEGVSLTVAAIHGNRVTIGIIPATAQGTTLGDLQIGARVNIETDMIAKYVERLFPEAQV